MSHKEETKAEINKYQEANLGKQYPIFTGTVCISTGKRITMLIYPSKS